MATGMTFIKCHLLCIGTLYELFNPPNGSVTLHYYTHPLLKKSKLRYSMSRVREPEFKSRRATSTHTHLAVLPKCKIYNNEV